MSAYHRLHDSWRQRWGEWLVYALLRTWQFATPPIPLWWTTAAMGRLAGLVAPLVPAVRRRVGANLDLVYPALAPAERRRLMADSTDQFVRLTVEYSQLHRFLRDVRIQVTGAEHLVAAAEAGRGAILVTAHYGNWEALRLACQRAGHPAGIIYRAFNNRYLDRYAQRLIAIAGEPVLQKGRAGMRALAAHIAGGGIALVLVDQRNTGAPLIDFLGHPAETVTVAATLAQRTGAALIPGCARRGPGGRFRVTIEPPVAPATPEAMMAEVNRRIGAWVAEAPEQWFWLHQRWRRATAPSHRPTGTRSDALPGEGGAERGGEREDGGAGDQSAAAVASGS
ncbi:MAG: hypothetical protein AAF677_08045 [Pseudomonadota bacterium]